MVEDYENKIFKLYSRYLILTFLCIMVIAGTLTAIGSLVNFSILPWRIQVQTAMIRNSNGYITSQQVALREFYTGYADAVTNEQKNASIRQMHEIADTIPGYVQSDIAAFLASH